MKCAVNGGRGAGKRVEAHGEERREGAERESRRSVKPSDDSYRIMKQQRVQPRGRCEGET